MSVHVERVGDELLLTVRDDDDEDGDEMVASLSIPGGVDELVKAIRAESS